MSSAYDAIIVGTGQAGPALANYLSRAGQKVAIIERKLIGGTCVNTGCVPTKALVASARAAHMARRGADFGVDVEGTVEVDMARVHARMKEISGDSNRGVRKWLEGLENATLIEGHARFVAPRRLEVNGERLEAGRIFLNVGGRALVPDMPGVRDVDVLTNSSMMAVDFLPAHLLIVGGSYIGLEFAQMYRRFGSRVTIIERGPRLIGREDEDVSETVREVLEREGVEIRLDADCIGFERRQDGIAATVECGEGPPEAVGSHLLLAVGRRPNTDDLGLEAAGIDADERGYIQVDDQLRTSAEGVWALGDCNGKGAFTHTAYNDFEIVAANLEGDHPRRVSDRITCYGLFVDPPLGRVGMTEKQAREACDNVLVGKRPMSKVSRAKERSETDGFIKILVDGDSQHILGGAILGIGGDEVIHTLLTAMYEKLPYTVISRAVHIHPTVAELIPTTLQSLRPLDEA